MGAGFDDDGSLWGPQAIQISFHMVVMVVGQPLGLGQAGRLSRLALYE